MSPSDARLRRVRRARRGFIFVSLLLSASVAQAAPVPAITSLAYSPDGKRLAVGTRGRVVVYETAKWTVEKELSPVEGYARALAFLPDNATIAIGCGIAAEKGEMFLWHSDTGACDRRYPPEKDTVEAVAVSADGKSLLIGANDNRGRYLPDMHIGTGPVLEEHNGQVTAAAFSSKPDFVYATGGMDKIVKIWDRKSSHTVVNFDQAQAGITGLVFLPGGDQLVGSSLDGNLYWWQVSYDAAKHEYSGSAIRNAAAHAGGVLALEISANGQRIVSGGQDHGVIVWKADDGSQVHAFTDAKQPIYAVALSPDGTIAAGAGREGIVYVWDVDGGKLLKTIEPAKGKE